MRIRSPKDFWSGVFFVVTALGFSAVAVQYGLGDMHRMGPGMFPVLVAALLAGLGLIVALRSLVLDGPPVPRFYARPIFVSLVAIASFGVALQWLGLAAAVVDVVLVSALASEESRLRETLLLAVGITAFSSLVFVGILGLPIPLWPWS
jgi:hypothetical protein